MGHRTENRFKKALEWFEKLSIEERKERALAAARVYARYARGRPYLRMRGTAEDTV